MKKFLNIILFCLCLFLVGCHNDNIVVDSFSYSVDSFYWVEGEVGMKTEEFNNTKEQKITSGKDALEVAKNEVTVSYDSTSVAFDEESNIWRVNFWTENLLGGNQIVYLNENGTTKICIWEE